MAPLPTRKARRPISLHRERPLNLPHVSTPGPYKHPQCLAGPLAEGRRSAILKPNLQLASAGSDMIRWSRTLLGHKLDTTPATFWWCRGQVLLSGH